MNKLVHGIGVNDRKYRAYIEGRPNKAYKLWKHMLHRCTDEYQTNHPTYTGTACSENFKSYTFFYEWCQTQVGFGNKDENGNCWQLDKDLLFKDNKLYSEHNCVFVPHRVNCLLIKSNASRGEHIIGVSLKKTSEKYVACCSVGNKNTHLGYFNTQIQAFKAYKEYKETVIKEVAEQYKLQLDSRVYAALMKYEVNIND